MKMLLKYYHSAPHNLTVLYGKGKLSIDVVLKSRENFGLFERKQESRCFCDFTQADLSDLSQQDLRLIRNQNIKLASNNKPPSNKELGNNKLSTSSAGGHRVALLTADVFEYGIGRMYSMLEQLEPLEFKAFLKLDESLAWLQLDADRLRSVAAEGDIQLGF
ncbi:MAG: hypothetical protein KUG79_01460 [Pseudomonadales bacterium]|nr:hypothetical protein [Pseudomonadales bacterium]